VPRHFDSSHHAITPGSSANRNLSLYLVCPVEASDLASRASEINDPENVQVMRRD
jgi:hypothetical protein